MSEGFLSILIHLEKEGSLWVPTYSPKYDFLGILLLDHGPGKITSPP